jgi:hypothetical protein
MPYNQLRGHFQIDLPDGTTLPCLLNMYAVQQWTSANGLNLTDLDVQLRENLLQAMPALTWYGVRTHYLLNDEEPPITETKFAILIGSADWTELAKNVTTALSLEEGPSPKKKGSPRNP